MSTRLKITKDGLKAWKWDGEEKGKHKIKKKDGKFHLINRETKEVVKVGDTDEEVEDIFWKPEEIDIVWPLLRESCTIEDGVTLGDLYDIIENNGDLKLLMIEWYPLYRDYRNENVLDEKEFKISQSAYWAAGNFCLEYGCPIPSLDVAHLPIKLDDTLKIYRGDDEIWRYRLPPFYCEVESNLSLLDIIDAVFRGCRNKRTCTLTKEGLFSDDGMVDDPFRALMDVCDIEDGLTLQDIFNFVEKDESLKDFIGPYSWCHIDDFHYAAKFPKERGTSLRNLLISKSVSINTRKYPDLEFSPDFHGEGPIEPDQLKDYGENPPDIITYGVSFTPMANIVDLPIKLEKEVKVFENYKEIGKAYVECTLLEILDAIYWEISFHGSPEEAEEMFDDLKGRVDEIKSGEAELKGPFNSAEEMFEELDKDEEDE